MSDQSEIMKQSFPLDCLLGCRALDFWTLSGVEATRPQFNIVHNLDGQDAWRLLFILYFKMGLRGNHRIQIPIDIELYVVFLTVAITAYARFGYVIIE